MYGDKFADDYGSTLSDFATHCRNFDRVDQLESVYRELILILDRQVDKSPEQYLEKRASALNNLGNSLRGRNNEDEAPQILLRAIVDFQRLVSLGREEYGIHFCKSMNNLALSLLHLDRRQEAENIILTTLNGCKKLSKGNQDEYFAQASISLGILAKIYLETGRKPRAIEIFREAVAIHDELDATKQEELLPVVAEDLSNLFDLYHESGDVKDTFIAGSRLLATNREIAKKDPKRLPEVAKTLMNLGVCCKQVEEFEGAEQCLQEAEEIIQPLWERDEQEHGDTLAKLLMNRSFLAEETDRPASEILDYSRRALSATNDPTLKAEIQQFIDRVSS